MILKCDFPSGKEFIVLWHLNEVLETFYHYICCPSQEFSASGTDSRIFIILKKELLSTEVFAKKLTNGVERMWRPQKCV